MEKKKKKFSSQPLWGVASWWWCGAELHAAVILPPITKVEVLPGMKTMTDFSPVLSV